MGCIPDLAAEWLEPDGIGGFASGTVDGVRTRRYHSLLLSAAGPPSGRIVLVNGVIAWIEHGAGAPALALSQQYYAPGVLAPDRTAQLGAFTRDPWPSWTYFGEGGDVFVHDVFVAPDSSETVLGWRRQSGSGPCWLKVRPLVSGRDYHALHHENPVFCFEARVEAGNVSWRPYASLPAIAALTNGTYSVALAWYRQFLYQEETARGLDDIEDLASPGVFTFDLTASDAVMVLRTGEDLGTNVPARAAALRAREQARRMKETPIRRAAACYNVARDGRHTLIAGFPWFTDWGRDTFIAMRGLVLTKGDLQAGEEILVSWAGAVSEGMLPNRFVDAGGVPEYNAVDASLWYIVAVHEFLERAQASGRVVSATTNDVLRAACEAILAGYSAGTRFRIEVDADGLLAAGVAGVQMTWMDAITNGQVVTPRIGKPVEIQALWINALEICGRRWSAHWAAAATRARIAFNARFPNPAGGLFDVVDDNHIPGAVDASVRPNQIFAVGGLPFSVLSGGVAQDVVQLVESKLLVPLGLRSLSPDDPSYQGRYRGGPAARDGAYHQGTAWPWLLGAFVDAWLAVRGRTAAAKAEAASRFLPALKAHLDVAGLGHISEIVDGDAPHTPRGCPFQAWSLGEFIRIEAMLA
jgi:predicted glycogen debranching enzyme